jgi:capsular polysaccharide export protein
LAELIAGTLLLYPFYLDPVTQLPCPAEILAERLTDPTRHPNGPGIRLRQLLRQGYGLLKRSGRKQFFFEKKNQKTF